MKEKLLRRDVFCGIVELLDRSRFETMPFAHFSRNLQAVRVCLNVYRISLNQSETLN